MYNEASLAAVDAARWGERFRKPLYASFNFAQLPGLVEGLLGGAPSPVAAQLLGPLAGQYQKVVLLLVDAFGWRFFQRYAERFPFLRRFVEQGLVTKLTAQFPSTTSAHVTTIHTGLPVGQSGVYEWFYYEPKLDAMIAPLMFSFAGDKDRDTLRQTGVDPASLFPRTTLYHRLQRLGVKATIVQPQEFTPSPFSDVVDAGAAVRAYANLPAGLTDLVQRVRAEHERAYFFLYFGGIDTVGHHKGPESPEFQAEVAAFFGQAEALLHGGLAGATGDTLLLMTADHGQDSVDPARTIYLNQTLPELLPLLRTTRAGRILAPGGSCKDLFLYVRDGALDEALALLRAQLAGRAEVHAVRGLATQGFFGTEPPSATFWERAGDLVILPYAGETVWWYEAGRFEQKYFGHHGGLNPAEMETPLLALRY